MSKPYKLAVKAVILNEENHCLLIRRSNVCHNFAGKWEWPGGKLDAGEDFATAVAREVREETSLAVKITGLAGATEFEMPAVHVVLLCMEAHITGDYRAAEIPLREFVSIPMPKAERLLPAALVR